MKKAFKKLLISMLSVAMVFTMTAMPVYADEEMPQEAAAITEAVDETEMTVIQDTETADPAEVPALETEDTDTQNDDTIVSEEAAVELQEEAVQNDSEKDAAPAKKAAASDKVIKAAGVSAEKKAEPAAEAETKADQVRKAIQELSIDSTSYTATDRARVEAIKADFDSLSSEDQAAIDAETSHSETSQPLGRVLESALWSVWSYDAVDDSTALADGTYDAASTPALSSVYSKGKSTSSRQKAWSVKSVTVENGHATATITVESDTYSGIWMGGKTYPKTNTSGNCEFAGVPIDLNSTFYFAGISTSMSVPIAFSLTTTIDESADAPVEEDADYTAVDKAIASVPQDLSVYTDESAKAVTDAVNAVVRGKKASKQAEVDKMAKAINDAVSALELKQDDLEDGELTITNNTGMFKAVKAYLSTENDQHYLVVVLSGSSYHEMFLGTYEEAVANGDNRDNWVHGYQNADGKWEFKIPVTAQDTYIPCVAISQTYLDKYDEGLNSLERSFYPRQFELDGTAMTLVTGDYEHSQELTVKNNIKMFKPSAAAIDTVGGPNSNNYSSDLILTMGSDAYDEMYVGTYKEAEKASKTIALANGNVFTVPVRWVETFGQPETMKTLIGETFKASFHSKSKDLWYEREITISEKDGTIVFDDVPADYSAVEAAKKKVPSDLSIYTDETAKAVTDAVAAAKTGKNIAEQEAVDAMAKAIEDAVAALELKPEEAGDVELDITNKTGMFKALKATLVTEGDDYYLVMALSGSGYRELFKGTYEEAVANGNNRDNWIHGYQNADGKWEFRIPVTAGETYVPCVAISQSYVDKYDAGQNPLERAFYPRQFTIDRKAKTLVTDDYNETVNYKVTSNVTDFKVSGTAETAIVGGPNSNNYSVSPTLVMLDKTYDEVIYPTVVGGEVSTAKAAIKDGKFEISLLNAPNQEAFKDKTPIEMTFHVASDADYKAAGKYVVRKVTIDKMAKTITIDGTPLEKNGSDKPDETVDPVKPDPSKPDDKGSSGGDSGYAPPVDSSTTLKDGTYTPDSFSWSGGTGKLSISCSSIEVKNGQAYATIVFSSTKVDQLKAAGGLYYKQGSGNAVFKIPVNLNTNNTIVARTTAMSQPHWIEYTIYVGLGEGEGQAEKAKEAKKAAAEAKVKISEEAPVIIGLDVKDAKSTIEYSKYFKIFEYDHGVKMLSIDISDKTELKEEYTKNAEKAIEASESEEEVQYDEEGKVIAKAKTEYIEDLYKNNVVNYLLVPEDYEVPAGLDKEYIIITVPAEKTFMASQEVIAMMEELGCLDAISLLGIDEKEVKNDTLKKALKDEKIKLAGNLEKPEYAKVVKDKSDLAVLPGDLLPEEIDKNAKDKDKEKLTEEAKEKKENLEKLESRFTALEVPVVIDRSAQEEDELAQAEWIKVYGALFGCDEEAEKIFEKKVKEAEKNEKN